jgi:hypothetical protein
LDLPGRIDRPLRTERENGVVTSAAWADARREKKSAVLSEGKSAWERDHRARKHSFAGCIEGGRKSHDGPRSAQSDIIPAVGSEIAAAWVQPGYRAGLAHHTTFAIERQNAVGATVEEEQRTVDPKSARVDDPGVLTERAKHLAVRIERQELAVTRAIHARGARHKKDHRRLLWLSSSDHLEGQSDPLAAADAHRDDTLLEAVPTHRMEEAGRQHSARRTDGMPVWPQTRFTVMAGTWTGSPPWIAAWRAGFILLPACTVFPMTTVPISSGRRLER